MFTGGISANEESPKVAGELVSRARYLPAEVCVVLSTLGPVEPEGVPPLSMNQPYVP